jgi:hypothetical protein
LSIETFSGNAFVAFLDICGFKDMVRNIPGQAQTTLNNFYRIVNEEATASEEINCIAISDSAIIFSGVDDSEINTLGQRNLETIEMNKLVAILRFSKSVALRMIDYKIAISGSIAYGRFEYQKRMAGDRVVKAMLLGSAYMDAYSDVEEGKPKLKLGQIRIKPEKKIKTILKVATNDAPELSLLKRETGGFYFYWMVNSFQELDTFKKEYDQKYSNLYDDVISTLRNYARRPV